VTLELILQFEGISDPGVELYRRVAGNCERLAIGRERVVGNWIVEKMMNLGRRHLDNLSLLAIGVALYYRFPALVVILLSTTVALEGIDC
jgi:hypothetical protein